MKRVDDYMDVYKICKDFLDCEYSGDAKRNGDIDMSDYVFKRDTEGKFLSNEPSCECKWHSDLYCLYSGIFDKLGNFYQECEKQKSEISFRIRTDCMVTYRSGNYEEHNHHQLGNFMIIPFFGNGRYFKNSLNNIKGSSSNKYKDNMFIFLEDIKAIIEKEKEHFDRRFDPEVLKMYVEYFRSFKDFHEFIKLNHLEDFEPHIGKEYKEFDDFVKETQDIIKKRTSRLVEILNNPKPALPITTI